MNYLQNTSGLANPSKMIAYKQYILTFISFASLFFLNGQNHTNFDRISPIFNGESIIPKNVVQDHLGHIWFSYNSGILKYDGYTYTSISLVEIFPTSSQDDQVKTITKDYHNNIWVVSANGLVSKFNQKGQFEPILLKSESTIISIYSLKKSLFFVSKNGAVYTFINNNLEKLVEITELKNFSKSIVDIELSDTNELFISTTDGIIFKYSLITNQISELKGPFSKYSGNLTLTTDKDNHLWIGTETSGLFVYDLINDTYIEKTLFSANQYNIFNELFITLFCDSKGNIWAGTDGGGLYYINTKNGGIQLFTNIPTNKFSLSSNTIMDITEDDHENIWILTNYGDINIFSNRNSNIKYHEGSNNNTPSRVLSIFKASNGDLWIGLDGTGLTRIVTNPDGSTSETQHFINEGIRKGFYIQTIAEDGSGNFWFGTYKNGLWFYDSTKKKFDNIPVLNSDFQKAKDIRTIFIDSKKRIWVGSSFSTNVYSEDKKLLASFENTSNGPNGNVLEKVIEEKNGTIWLGYIQSGLFKLNEDKIDFKNSTFTRYPYCDESVSNGDYGILDMTMDNNGTIWLIDNHLKLINYHPDRKTYDSINKVESLKNIAFHSIQVDNNNNLWLGSNNGIWFINMKDTIITTYYKKDGIQDNFLLKGSSFKDENGLLYFGGENGLNFFNPEKINKKKSLAELHIDVIEILNQPAELLIPNQILSGIFNVNKLNLKHDYSSFSFKFSAIDDILDSNFFYQYRLKGFNDKWISTQKERVATYTNIPAGNYIFEVRAGTQRNLWDIATKQIVINIDKPFWNKPMAYFIYLILFAILAYGFKRWYVLKKKLFYEKINHKKENELHSLKMNFFTKMSHEIQTPITLILSPIDDMILRAGQNGNLLLKQRLDIISNNVKRLSRIAFELTATRDKELGKMTLAVTKNNLCEDLQNISLAFQEYARLKQIDFTTSCPRNLTNVWYDRDKIEHIIYNLLSNAFKFTPKEGNIQLVVIPMDKKNAVKISIIDSGPGIPKEELENIFTLFYQAKIGRQKKGAGIGLALTKDIVNLHHGKIKVKSTTKEGTVFTVTLPISKDSYTDQERLTDEDEDIQIEKLIVKHEINQVLKKSEKEKTRKTILIVEDSFELQAFLKELLSSTYNIIQAENGEEGYHFAKNSLPDLILSDIMMPKIDGIEMCKMLHNNISTNHIPIILITAKNSSNSKILGLKSGAIEYINKPFNTNELLLKINNIISAKELIISKYRKEVITSPDIKLKKSQDDIFLENLMKAINDRIENANFKIEELADSLNMSYSVLYRKCNTLTGKSLVDFVRELRLKKAAVLITKFGYSISETSFMVGFNDPKYFSKCFKKQFGKSPKLFKLEAVEMGAQNYLETHHLENIV